MAKKKSSKANRKHQFKYAAPQSTTTVASPSKAAVAGAAGAVSAGAATVRDFSYVKVDLRRTAILGGSLIVLQFVLWYVFNHTGLGPSIYNLVKVQ